jgi:hypothetical protein
MEGDENGIGDHGPGKIYYEIHEDVPVTSATRGAFIVVYGDNAKGDADRIVAALKLSKGMFIRSVK